MSINSTFNHHDQNFKLELLKILNSNKIKCSEIQNFSSIPEINSNLGSQECINIEKSEQRIIRRRFSKFDLTKKTSQAVEKRNSEKGMHPPFIIKDKEEVSKSNEIKDKEEVSKSNENITSIANSLICNLL